MVPRLGDIRENTGDDLPARENVGPIILGYSGGQRDRPIPRIDPIPAEGSDFATALSGKNDQGDDCRECVVAANHALVDRREFVVRQDAISGFLRARGHLLARILLDVVPAERPIEKHFQGDQRMALFRRCIRNSFEPPDDVIRRNVGKLPPAKGEMLVEKPGVVLDSTRLVFLLALREKESLSVAPRDAAGPELTKRSLGKDAARFASGVSERNNRIAADRNVLAIGSVLNDEAFSGALRYAAAEVRKSFVKVDALTLGGNWELAHADVG